MIPNGADLSRFHPRLKSQARASLNIDPRRLAVAYIGQIGDYYRLDVVVRAMEGMRSLGRIPPILLLLGSGPSLAFVLQLAESAGLRQDVLYLGATDDTDRISQVLSAADAGIIPYDDNPLWVTALPAKVFEYLACGLPVIATARRESLLAQLVEENEVGTCLPPLDAEALTTTLCRLDGERSVLATWGQRGRRLVEDRYDRQRIASRFHALLAELERDGSAR